MSVVSVLKQADIFYELTTTLLELIASICEERQFDTGDMVFAENTVGDEGYVIANGEVDILGDPAMIGVTPKDTAGPRTIATLRRDPSFGEGASVGESRL